MATKFASPFQPGQLVVHATHGVSRYAGTKMMEGADGRSEEYFQLEYADGHRVFVPVEHVARLTKHVGDEVALTRLTVEFQRRSPYGRLPKPK